MPSIDSGALMVMANRTDGIGREITTTNDMVGGAELDEDIDSAVLFFSTVEAGLVTTKVMDVNGDLYD